GGVDHLFPTRRSSDLAADRRFGQLVRLGEGGGLADDAAQAKARLGVEIGRLQPPVVEAEALRGDILEIEFPVVAAGEGGGGEARSEEHTSELQSRENL